MVMGVLPINAFTKQAPFIGNALELILLSMGLADRFNYEQEQALKKEKTLTATLELGKNDVEEKNRKIEELNSKLENRIEERTNQLDRSLKETNSLLNNIKTSVFAIGKDFKVLPPVSKCSERIFGEDIIGKRVSEFLFYNVRKGTKTHRDLWIVFSIVFGSDEIQFFGLEDNLPKLVTLPDQTKKGEINQT